MRVMLRGLPVDVDDSHLLGAGGEARVYAHPDPTAGAIALKIFHSAASSGGAASPTDARMRALRTEKLRALCGRTAPLPPRVIAPRDELRDPSTNEVIGYAMARVPNAVDIARLAQRSRLGVIDAPAVLRIVRALHEIVEQLHAQQIVVGDLNDGNVLVTDAGRGDPALIDVDSMQLGDALPCPVAHERFLDPRLFGRDLLARACFDVASDTYALRVLLVQSLLLVHPYGGVHARFKTLLRRAESAWSIFRSGADVTLPKSALPIDTLPDPLLHDLTRCFDDGVRTPIDARLLDETAARFRKCASCSIEHTRPQCPACKTTVAAPAIRTHGGVAVEIVVDTRGLVLQARMIGGHLAVLVEENDRVRREDFSTVLHGPRAPSMRLEIADADRTWLALDSELVCVAREQIVDRARTSIVHGAPSFSATASGLFVVEGDAIVHHETRERIGRVLEAQTVLLHEIALCRAGRMLLAYRFARGRFADVVLPQPTGKIVDVAVTLAHDGSGDALIGIATDERGARRHALHLIDARGAVRASISGAPDDSPLLHTIRGQCLGGGRFVAPTREGVVAAVVDGAHIREGSAFPDTAPFVDDSVELLPGPAGSLFVVQPQSVARLRLRQ